MCMSACSSSTAPSVSVDVAGAAGTQAFVPAIGGDAETGVGAIGQDTEFDPNAAGATATTLAQQLQQAQALLVAGADGAATSAAGDAGTTAVSAYAGPTPGAFAAALGQRIAVQLEPMSDGASLLRNLDSIVAARTERVARLEDAFLVDSNATPADQARLDQERALLRDTKALRDKLEQLASTIDASEAEAVLRLVGLANQRGEYVPEQLAEVMIQVEGSAHDLPASYLDLAQRVQDLLEQTRADMELVAKQAGDADPTTIAQLEEMTANQEAAQEALKANFELAKRDPATAQAQLQAFAQAA